jgi:hypothetical protein
MGRISPPLYGKTKREKIKKRIAKLNKKIAGLEADKKVYEEMLVEKTENSN